MASASASAGISPHSFERSASITPSTVAASKRGRNSRTSLSESSVLTRRCSGVRTIRPSSCAMYVESRAVRNDTIVSARGQSHPVERFSLNSTTRIPWSPAMRLGSTARTFSPPSRTSARAPPNVCTISPSRNGRPNRSPIFPATAARSVADTAPPDTPASTCTTSTGSTGTQFCSRQYRSQCSRLRNHSSVAAARIARSPARSALSGYPMRIRSLSSPDARTSSAPTIVLATVEETPSASRLNRSAVALIPITSGIGGITVPSGARQPFRKRCMIVVARPASPPSAPRCASSITK